MPTTDSQRYQVTIEGKWAYVPILDRPTPSDPSRPNAGMDYKGVAMPIMIVEAGEDGSKRREHEVHEQLPPIVSDHHHDDRSDHADDDGYHASEASSEDDRHPSAFANTDDARGHESVKRSKHSRGGEAAEESSKSFGAANDLGDDVYL